jgi:SPP1 family predicted phage head-tail adaptor
MGLGTTGNRRNLVTIEAPVETPGPTGEPVRTWQTVKQVWAAIDTVQGSEYYRSDQLQGSRPVRIWIRVVPGLVLSVRHRLRLGDRVFDINDIRNVQERGAMWDITATEASR